jgi:hypothetical protein
LTDPWTGKAVSIDDDQAVRRASHDVRLVRIDAPQVARLRASQAPEALADKGR